VEAKNWGNMCQESSLVARAIFSPARVIEDVSFSRAARGPRWTRRDLWGRMRLSWKFPNDTSLASVARWGLACSGVATLACAFITDPPEAGVDSAPEPLSTDARDPDALARWMRRTSSERGAGTTLRDALSHVGPWAPDQRPADNDAPARVPTSSSSRRSPS
jgi:hypothetical protein